MSDKILKQLTKVKGIVTDIKLTNTKVEDYTRILVELVTSDEQKLYLESRNLKAKEFKERIEIGDYIEVEFSFEGNQDKFDRCYNNLKLSKYQKI